MANARAMDRNKFHDDSTKSSSSTRTTTTSSSASATPTTPTTRRAARISTRASRNSTSSESTSWRNKSWSKSSKRRRDNSHNEIDDDSVVSSPTTKMRRLSKRRRPGDSYDLDDSTANAIYPIQSRKRFDNHSPTRRKEDIATGKEDVIVAEPIAQQTNSTMTKNIHQQQPHRTKQLNRNMPWRQCETEVIIIDNGSKKTKSKVEDKSHGVSRSIPHQQTQQPPLKIRNQQNVSLAAEVNTARTSIESSSITKILATAHQETKEIENHDIDWSDTHKSSPANAMNSLETVEDNDDLQFAHKPIIRELCPRHQLSPLPSNGSSSLVQYTIAANDEADSSWISKEDDSAWFPQSSLQKSAPVVASRTKVAKGKSKKAKKRDKDGDESEEEIIKQKAVIEDITVPRRDSYQWRVWDEMNNQQLFRFGFGIAKKTNSISSVTTTAASSKKTSVSTTRDSNNALMRNDNGRSSLHRRDYLQESELSWSTKCHVVYRMFRVRMASGRIRSAVQLLHDMLIEGYEEAEHLWKEHNYQHNQQVEKKKENRTRSSRNNKNYSNASTSASLSSDPDAFDRNLRMFSALRTQLAGLWCVYAHCVIELGELCINQQRQEQKKDEGKSIQSQDFDEAGECTRGDSGSDDEEERRSSEAESSSSGSERSGSEEENSSSEVESSSSEVESSSSEVESSSSEVESSSEEDSNFRSQPTTKKRRGRPPLKKWYGGPESDSSSDESDSGKSSSSEESDPPSKRIVKKNNSHAKHAPTRKNFNCVTALASRTNTATVSRKQIQWSRIDNSSDEIASSSSIGSSEDGGVRKGKSKDKKGNNRRIQTQEKNRKNSNRATRRSSTDGTDTDDGTKRRDLYNTNSSREGKAHIRSSSSAEDDDSMRQKTKTKIKKKPKKRPVQKQPKKRKQIGKNDCKKKKKPKAKASPSASAEKSQKKIDLTFEDVRDYAFSIFLAAGSCPLVGNHADITLALGRLILSGHVILEQQEKERNLQQPPSSPDDNFFCNSATMVSLDPLKVRRPFDLAVAACWEGINRCRENKADGTNVPQPQRLGKQTRSQTFAYKLLGVTSGQDSVGTDNCVDDFIDSKHKTIVSLFLSQFRALERRLGTGQVERYQSVSRGQKVTFAEQEKSFHTILDLPKSFRKICQTDRVFCDHNSIRSLCMELNRWSRLKERVMKRPSSWSSLSSSSLVLQLVPSPSMKPLSIQRQQQQRFQYDGTTSLSSSASSSLLLDHLPLFRPMKVVPNNPFRPDMGLDALTPAPLPPPPSSQFKQQQEQKALLTPNVQLVQHNTTPLSPLKTSPLGGSKKSTIKKKRGRPKKINPDELPVLAQLPQIAKVQQIVSTPQPPPPQPPATTTTTTTKPTNSDENDNNSNNGSAEGIKHVGDRGSNSTRDETAMVFDDMEFACKSCFTVFRSVLELELHHRDFELKEEEELNRNRTTMSHNNNNKKRCCRPFGPPTSQYLPLLLWRW